MKLLDLFCGAGGEVNYGVVIPAVRFLIGEMQRLFDGV